MPLFRRPDGDLVTDLPADRQMMQYLMPRRNDAAVYHEQVLDLSKTRPWLRAYTDGFAAMKADTQPPFRPDGPNPAISRSTTATRRSGCCAFR